MIWDISWRGSLAKCKCSRGLSPGQYCGELRGGADSLGRVLKFLWSVLSSAMFIVTPIAVLLDVIIYKVCIWVLIHT